MNCLPFRSTWVHPGFQWDSCYSIFSFMCMFCRSLFVLFLLAIVLSVLFRYTDSDKSFGIFKLLLGKHRRKHSIHGDIFETSIEQKMCGLIVYGLTSLTVIHVLRTLTKTKLQIKQSLLYLYIISFLFITLNISYNKSVFIITISSF